MRKRSFIIIVLLVTVATFSACGSFSDYRRYLDEYDEFQEYKAYKESLQTSLTVPETVPETVGATAPVVESTEASQVPPEDYPTVSGSDMQSILNLVEQRKQVYTWSNSFEKTMKINELDNQILALGDYDFSGMIADFVGDSITEGVGGNEDLSGNKISYVNYVQELLGFKQSINNGLAGRMFASHNNPELSIEANETSLININAQTVVIYAGINDFLCTDEIKIFGEIDSGSTSGYCGQLQSFTKSLMNNYPDKDYFFVTSYQINTEDTSVYKDLEGKATLNDYMEPQRFLAERNGFHIIELYNTGFMSMQGEGNWSSLFADSIHPNNEGYRVLGEHIAAEILLYYLGVSE